ncbi:MAG TPA: flagellar basal body rod protein FlgC [Symbiobacteriaceae bacterium]|nr:flagellar basal body rod protein FlgC [Symbiobacteriaceae bacterium]
MKWFSALETSASALTAERLRMDVISNNIANANTTRTPEGGPYRRQMVVLGSRPSFAATLQEASGQGQAQALDQPDGQIGRGVRVVQILQDQRPFKLKYDPTHPDADANGYVQLPNVETVTEMVDLISASRAYEANVTALNAFKQMVSTALQIGR